MAGTAPTAAGPSWRLKSVILVSAVPMALGFSSVTPILPKMSAALAHDATGAWLVKMVLGVVGIAMVLGGPLSGLLADKIPRRPLLAVAALVAALAGVIPFFTASLPLILASRLVMGLAAMTVYVTGAAVIADSFEETERARWMGLFTAVAVVGGLVALLAAGLLGDIGWRWPFLTYLIGVPIAALAWIGLAEAPTAASAGSAPRTSRATAAPAAQGAPFPFALALLGLVIGVVIYAPSIYIPFHLASLGAAQPSTIGKSLTLSMISSTATSALFGRIRRRLSARAAFCCSFGAQAAGVAVIALAPSFPVSLVGIFIMGLGVGALSPNLMASAADAVGEEVRGRVLGVVRAAYSLAPAIGVSALEPIAARVGAQGVLLLAAALAGLMMLGMALAGLRPTARRAGRAPGAARIPSE